MRTCCAYTTVCVHVKVKGQSSTLLRLGPLFLSLPSISRITDLHTDLQLILLPLLVTLQQKCWGHRRVTSSSLFSGNSGIKLRLSDFSLLNHPPSTHLPLLYFLKKIFQRVKNITYVHICNRQTISTFICIF